MDININAKNTFEV